MTIYEFMSLKTDCIKTIFPCLNLIALMAACSMLEEHGKKPSKILVPGMLYDDFSKRSTGDNKYAKVIRDRRLLSAEIEIDENQKDPIVVIMAGDDTPFSKVMLYIGSIG